MVGFGAPSTCEIARSTAGAAAASRGLLGSNAKEGDLRTLLEHAQEVSADYRGDVDVAELVALIGKAARLTE